MSVKIISGPELAPLQIEENLSKIHRRIAFLKELSEFSDQVFMTRKNFPNKIFMTRRNFLENQNYKKYIFEDFFVNVHPSVLEKFNLKFKPYINRSTTHIHYDNLINICIMVKNAGDGFRDILQQNLPYIDRYTILDTGSTDNTLSIAREVLKDKRGVIYEEPFINFRDSRNRLLDLAGEHCYFNIMLDDTYVLNGKLREFLDLARGDNVVSSYSLAIEDNETMYASNRITKSSHGLRYVNTVHEIISSENNINVSIPYSNGFIKDISSQYMSNRTTLRKQEDINTLLKMLEDDPTNPRTYYYIADSYICMKDWKNAVKWFEERIKYGGYKGEIQDSLYYIASIKNEYLNCPWEECEQWYLKCYEVDHTRAEPLFFIGRHYLQKGDKELAFSYLKKAYSLGMPSIQMSVRKNIYNIHIPKALSSICYEMGEYELGEECCRKFLENGGEDVLTTKWLNIFYHINKTKNIKDTRVKCTVQSISKTICFISPGGWKEWDGETLRTKGLGGSETFTIKYAEYLTAAGYDVVVFCKCEKEKEYLGVVYKPVESYYEFCRSYVIDICIINRFSEYIPASCINGSKTYFVLHDIASTDSIITMHPNLAAIFCLSEWHKKNFLHYYPTCAHLTNTISYGIETGPYDIINIPIDPLRFIYPNFPNRGLRQLLTMWPAILVKYPTARLDCFCDTQNSWCQQYWSEDMKIIDSLLEQHKDTVFNHGWVNGDTLKQFWKRAHVWLYPCTFNETCCLTAWEAAASKTLVVSNNLAALSESIGDRGVIVHGDSATPEWQQEILYKMFSVLDNNLERSYTDRNYSWVKTKNFKDVIDGFSDTYIK